MRTAVWIALALALAGFDLWIVFGPTVTHNPLLIGLIMFVFAAPNIGAFWMLYMAVRYEIRPLSMIALAMLVPGAFLRLRMPISHSASPRSRRIPDKAAHCEDRPLWLELIYDHQKAPLLRVFR